MEAVYNSDHNPRFEAARIHGNLSVQDLWVRYLAVGGHCEIFDIDAHLQGVLALDPIEQDTLAWALNERLDELTAAAHVPYLKPSQATPDALLEVVSDLIDDGWSSAPPP
jgi:hypothetical protein